MQHREGADRQTLASAAAAPALIGHRDGTTPEVRKAGESLPLGNAAAGVQANAQQVTRAEIARGMAEIRAAFAELRKRRGAEIEAMATAWMRDNPDAMRYIERRALEEAAAKRRFSVRLLLEEARKKDFADRAGRGTKINNVIAPAIARALVRKHPGMRPFVTLRRSMVDEAD